MFFFFSSRRRHTRSTRDWSSDVCSSDLVGLHTLYIKEDYYNDEVSESNETNNTSSITFNVTAPSTPPPRSEERRVGKESRAKQWPETQKRNTKSLKSNVKSIERLNATIH